MINEPSGFVTNHRHLVAFYLHFGSGVILTSTGLNNQKWSLEMITTARNTVGGGKAIWCGPCGGYAVGVIPHKKWISDSLLVNTNPLPCPHNGFGSGISRILSKGRERSFCEDKKGKQISHHLHGFDSIPAHPTCPELFARSADRKKITPAKLKQLRADWEVSRSSTLV